MGTFDAVMDFLGMGILVVSLYGVMVAWVVLGVASLFETRRLYGRWF